MARTQHDVKPARAWLTPVTAPLLIAAAVFATFARALPYPLQKSWDDGRFIIDNPLVRAPSWDALREIASGPKLEAYHPLHLLSYWLDVAWAGPQPLLVHGVSMALWIAAAIALLKALNRLGLSQTAATIATLACVLHPVQVEAVSWATGRKDVLALLFSALCLGSQLRSQRPLDRHAWLARLWYACGALAKTTVLPLPLVLGLIDVLVRGRTLRSAALSQLPSALLGSGLAALVLSVWSGHEMIRPPDERTGPMIVRVAATVGHQLQTAFWPGSTSPMYSTSALASLPLSAFMTLFAFALIALGLWSGMRNANRQATLGLLGLISFAILMVPVGNVVPMYYPFEDRYLSLPLLGLAIALGAACDVEPSRTTRALAAALVCALALRAVQYQGEWSTETRLWGHAASTQPNAYYAWLKLGEVRRTAGDFHGSIRAYREALTLEPQRKTGYAALMYVVALRDERIAAIAPTQAERYAERMYRSLGDAGALRSLASELIARGYQRAYELPLGVSFALQPLDDKSLERAALTQLQAGQAHVAVFIAKRMKTPSERPELRGAIEARAQSYPSAPAILD